MALNKVSEYNFINYFAIFEIIRKIFIIPIENEKKI